MNGMQTLVIADYGTRLGVRGERVVVRRDEEILDELPFFRIGRIVIGKKGVSLSADVIRECSARGIRIAFLDTLGRPYAILSSPDMIGTARTRRAQLAAYHDRRGVEVCRTIVAGKLHNQANFLKYLVKNANGDRETLQPSLHALAESITEGATRTRTIEAGDADQARVRLLPIEGGAGRLYWEGVVAVLGRPDFEKRVHPGATDPVNASLNYGYGVLESEIWSALLNAGLDPFAGFLHADRPGRPSLVFDLMEEFRQAVVDRAIVALFQRHRPVSTDPADGRLDPESRRLVSSQVLERLDSRVDHRGHRLTLRSVIQSQAYRLVSFLREECRYRAYRFAW